MKDLYHNSLSFNNDNTVENTKISEKNMSD